MKHLAIIQAEFLKDAAKWEDLSYEAQKEYLKKHRKSKKKMTAKPDQKGSVTDLKESIEEKRQQIKPKQIIKIDSIDTLKNAIKRAFETDEIIKFTDGSTLKHYFMGPTKMLKFTESDGISGIASDPEDMLDDLVYQYKLGKPSKGISQTKSEQFKPQFSSLKDLTNKYPALSNKAKKLFKIDQQYDPNGSGNIDWENGGEMQFSTGSDDNWHTMTFDSTKEMAKALNKFADYVQKNGKNNIEGEEQGNSVDLLIGDDGIEFNENFDDVKSPDYYRQLAAFFESHPNLEISANQD